MIEYFIYFAVFAAALLMFEVVVGTYVARRERNRAVNRRLNVLKTLPENAEALSLLLHERGIGDEASGVPFSGSLRTLWTQSGVTITLLKFAGATTGTAAAVASVISLSVSNIYLITAVFVVLAALLPFATLRRMRTKRILRFAHQLPNALDVMVRSLKAGHPVSSSISLVARETPDPVGSEFGMTSDQLTFGQDIETAMTNLYRRVGAEELRLLVTTISIQRSTGGNLAEVLQNLSEVIRERIHMRARIRALSAEGRFTAWIMACFPFVIYFSLRTVTPTYFDTFWASPFVLPVLLSCAFLMIVGNYILFRMVNFDF